MDLEQIKHDLLSETRLHAELARAYAAACASAAQADHDLKAAEARAYLSVAAEDEAGGGKKRSEGHRGAIVDSLCELPRLKQRLAEAERDGLKARLEACRSAVSAFQSVLKVETEEAAMARYTPRTQGEAYAGAHEAPV